MFYLHFLKWFVQFTSHGLPATFSLLLSLLVPLRVKTGVSESLRPHLNRPYLKKTDLMLPPTGGSEPHGYLYIQGDYCSINPSSSPRTHSLKLLNLTGLSLLVLHLKPNCVVSRPQGFLLFLYTEGISHEIQRSQKYREDARCSSSPSWSWQPL